MGVFERIESEVRGYCRSFPVVFSRATNALLFTERGGRYVDFLAGAGALNYGHNNPLVKRALLDYLERDGVVHGLDMFTEAKQRFLHAFERRILWPLESEYKVQFTGPTGTNAVEAAIKLARKVTRRTNIVSFTNGFHGVTLGSLEATGSSHFRDAAGIPLGHATFMPYDGYLGDEVDTLDYFRRLLEDESSGLDLPAAVIVETVQGEGGVNVARAEWLQGLRMLCDEFELLLIIDDIQAGCGRTGTFFSFEEAGILPDLVTLSKSLSASGLPMSLLLMRPELDEWKPGEHNGTFRGNNLAFVSATAALERYWADGQFARDVRRKGAVIGERLTDIAGQFPGANLSVRGRGMMWGVASESVPTLASAVSRTAFGRGLVIETSGSNDQVLKLLPPLTIEPSLLEQGLDVIEASYREVLAGGAAEPRRDAMEVNT